MFPSRIIDQVGPSLVRSVRLVPPGITTPHHTTYCRTTDTDLVIGVIQLVISIPVSTNIDRFFVMLRTLENTGAPTDRLEIIVENISPKS